MPTTEKLRNKLMAKLTELFQLDQPDLDFGFYRIMQAKAEQVKSFIDKDLLQIIEDAFGQIDEGRKAELAANIEKEIEAAKSYGVRDPENSPKVMEVKEKYESLKDGASAESDVYDHLYRFFERYYDEGDFISRRYYARENAGKAAPFAIPYNGEEVKLHWANADQYYIKTAEYFSNYSFDITQAAEIRKMLDGEKVLNGIPEKTLKVHFRIVDASEGEHGNVKAAEDKKRFFILHEENPVEFNDADELVINFEYKALPSGKNSVDADTEKALKEKFGKSLNKKDMPTLSIAVKVIDVASGLEKAKKYLSALGLPAPTDKIPKRPLLAKYINQYTARNTCDYFIHKDLSGFLKRELDFYIKNEVMHLDDIENADAPAVENYLAKLKVIRRIATKLIDFLAQLEDFQKKLWLKKKFVTETNYCITLDRIPKELYGEIAANDAQREEWIKLFAIDEIKGDTGRLPGMGSPAYSVPLTMDFLNANDKLVLDTAFFSCDFKAKLIASIEDFDEQCDGLLIHGDNFHGLNLLQKTFMNTAKCVYLDPPYNTAVSAIPYKNNYRHSSWATMMADRLSLVQSLMCKASACFVSIDKNERNSLEGAMDYAFGKENKVEELIWIQNTNDGRAKTFSTNHEYVEVYAKDLEAAELDYSMFREPKPGFEEVMHLISTLNPQYPAITDIQISLKTLYKEHLDKYKHQVISEGLKWEEEKRNDPWKGVYQYKFAEYRDSLGKYVQESEARKLKAKIWVYRESDWTIMESDQKQSNTTKDPNHPNYRYYQPIHPITGKPCKMPSRGWKGTQFIDPVYPARKSWESLSNDKRIAIGEDESKVPQQKRFLHEVDTNVAKSIFVDYADGEKETTNLFGHKGVFLAPKHTKFVSRFILQATSKNSWVIDAFGGSGSTAGAVIECNRIDEMRRKFILMEANSYIDRTSIPRIKKTVYSPGWKNGKPTSRDTGISHCFKYIRLESYEDTLNNLRYSEDAKDEWIRNSAKVRKEEFDRNKPLREDYMLHYLLDVETRGSQSLLNIDDFVDPWAYTMRVKKPGSDETVACNVDLFETFNYLIGLRITHIGAPEWFDGDFTRKPDPELPEDQHTKLVVDGRIRQVTSPSEEEAKGLWKFRRIEGWIPADSLNPNNGHLPAGKAGRKRVLVVWRTLPAYAQLRDNEEFVASQGLEGDNLMLDEWFRKYYRISTRDFEYDTIYVNGSNNLPNLKKDNENWKVRLIEEEFHKKMWEVE